MKSESSPTAQQSSLAISKTKRLMRFILNPHSSVMLIGSLIAVLLIGATAYFGVLIPNHLQATATSKHLYAQQAAKLIDFSFNSIAQRVTFLAAQPNAKAALASKDQVNIDAFNTQIAQSFPDATIARAIPIGMIDTPQAGEEIGFTPVDLIRRSEKNEDAKPQAAKKDESWMMYFVAPVTDTANVRTGTLLVGIPVTAITKIWADLDNDAGKYSLLQDKTLIKQQGSGDGGDEIINLSYADLIVKFQANNIETGSFGLNLFIGAILAALLLNVIAVFIGETRLQKQLRDDSAHLLKFIHAIVNAQPCKMPVMENPLFNGIAQSLEHYSKLAIKNKEKKMAAEVAEKIKKAKPDVIQTDEAVNKESGVVAETTEAAAVPTTEPAPTSEATQVAATGSTEPVFEHPEEDLDIDLINELDDLFGNVIESTEQESGSAAVDSLDIDALSDSSAKNTTANVAHEIFRAYDIRGIVGETLTDDVVHLIGLAIGTEALTKGERTIMVGYDGRLSSPQLNAVLCKAIAKTGCQVTSIGQVSTPVLYYATATRSTRSGVMITGSHNPPNYNGFKIVLAGKTLSGEDIQAIYDRIQKGQFASGDGYITDVTGITDRYIKHIIKDITLERPLKVVVDCGNGAAGLTAPETLKGINCEVIPLYCDVDGHFPNHHPDPSNPKNMVDLIAKVESENADIGIAFDGDGDRLGIVTNEGNIIHPDRILAILAKSVLAKNKGGSVIFDVKCSRILPQAIREAGGVPIMWKTGHSFIKSKLKETDALLAGEMSGHIFFNERWFGFDDGLYSATRLLEVLAQRQTSSQALFDTLPPTISTPEINIAVAENKKFGLIEKLVEGDVFSGGESKVSTIDGVRVDFPNGWGLVRASNTTPCLVLRFEADTQEALTKIQVLFKEKLLALDADLPLSF